MDLVGGYEQVDPGRGVVSMLKHVQRIIQLRIINDLRAHVPHNELLEVLQILQSKAGAEEKLRMVHSGLLKLAEIELDSDLHSLLVNVESILLRPTEISQAKFEWVDGLLVRALQNGQWLILDNANLCSSSVLDRLNALLEPNGVLNINEHSETNGEPRVVKPHPNFRIFLTVDPRYGELSRAMRNRAVELFLLPEAENKFAEKVTLFPYESAVYRLRNAGFDVEPSHEERSLASLADVTMDHMSLQDFKLFPQLQKQLSAGLLSNPLSSDHLSRSLSVHLHLKAVWPAVAQKFYESITGSRSLTLKDVLAQVSFNLVFLSVPTDTNYQFTYIAIATFE